MTSPVVLVLDDVHVLRNVECRLAALYRREGGPLASAAFSFDGDDRLVSDYMESEFLSRTSLRQRAFLTRTAVLERMCGPLCDAVLQVSGSAAVLADLAGANLLLVPLDRPGSGTATTICFATGCWRSCIAGSPP
jgi:ATP/maltotriose-dependent transcriptional regulator MalT